MKIKSLLIIFIFAFGIPLAGIAQSAELLQQKSQDFSEVAAIAIPAVVSVQVKSKTTKSESLFDYDPSFEFFQDEFFGRFFGIPRKDKLPNNFQISQGSGFIISSDGYILTNSHVVRDQVNLTIKLNDGREFPGKVIGDDESTDVALIKIEADHLPYLTLGNSDSLRVGQWVVAIGNTLGLQATLTVGVVSAKGRSNLDLTRVEDFIQTDAAINRGNSGGPLLNMQGEVVGINTAIATNMSSGYMGIGFAIPSNMAKNVMEQLQETGSFTRGYLGVVLQEITSDLAQAFDLKKIEGALIADVQKDSPAEKAGIRQGDIIIKVNQQMVGNIGSLRNLIALQKPGTKMHFSILRDKKPIEMVVELGTLQESDAKAEANNHSNALGLEVQTLTPELRTSLGFMDINGVLITKVVSGSAAEMAGIKKGALILAINQQPVASKEQFDQIIKHISQERMVVLLIKQGTSVGYVVIKPTESSD